MADGIRKGDPRGFNKGRSSKFLEGAQVWQTPEEGQKTYRPECCGNNKDGDNSLKTLNDIKFSQVSWTLFSILADLNNADDLYSSSYLQVLKSLYQYFGVYTECTNYNWYHRHLHVP